MWRRGRDCRAASTRSTKPKAYSSPDLLVCTSAVPRGRALCSMNTSLGLHNARETWISALQQRRVGGS
jgi:hypothetical protein